MSQLYLGFGSVLLSRVVSGTSCQPRHRAACKLRDTSCTVAYRRSFSIRSTWVIIILRQQYRRQPSVSMASLEKTVKTCRAETTTLPHTHREHPHPAAEDSAPKGHRRPSLLFSESPRCTEVDHIPFHRRNSARG